jgi:thioredoxin 1
MVAILNESDLNVDSGLFCLKMHAPWCAPCKKLTPVIDKMKKEFENIKFYSIDIDQVPSIAQRYRVRSVPCLILVKNGQEMNRINGLILTTPLRKALSDLSESVLIKN